ncbi:MAG: DUF2948 family protein [Paracoccaceae bacterium]
MTDARFEDGAERPLYLQALSVEDIEVISSLVQDAVFPITEISWRPRARRFGLLLNRFRWEDRAAAEARGRPYERVQTVLDFADVLKVSSQGIDRSDKDLVLSLLAVSFEPGEDGAGRILLTLAGDGVIALDVECIDVTLKDVTRPYIAPSRAVPRHD